MHLVYWVSANAASQMHVGVDSQVSVLARPVLGLSVNWCVSCFAHRLDFLRFDGLWQVKDGGVTVNEPTMDGIRSHLVKACSWISTPAGRAYAEMHLQAKPSRQPVSSHDFTYRTRSVQHPYVNLLHSMALLLTRIIRASCSSSESGLSGSTFQRIW